MRLYIDLTADEEADIHGWVNHYAANPGELPTRLVLKERSQARLQQIAAQFGGQSVPAPPPPPPPSTGTVYEARQLEADDWVYYVQTPAVEWRVQGPAKAARINSYQSGGTNYGYFLDNFQRVRTTYAGILVQP